MTDDRKPLMKDLAHAERGGSNSNIWTNCGYFNARRHDIPKPPVGEAAPKGNAQHDAMEFILDREDYVDPHSVLGVQFGDYVITEDWLFNGVLPALEYFDDVVGDADFEIEITSDFPGIDDSFGTADVVFFPAPDRMGILDWKFGHGHVGAVGNSQLQFYACCMLERFDLWDKVTTVEMHIAQPYTHNFDKWEVPVQTLIAFREKAIRSTMLLPIPVMGAHCKYCHVGPICPAKKQQAAELIQWHKAKADLAEWMEIADQLDAQIKAVRAAVYESLTRGVGVPGWKLVKKRATREWAIDNTKIERYLRKHGLKVNDFAPRNFVSVAQAEKLLKPKGAKVKDVMVNKESTGLTMARDTDKRAAEFAGPADLTALAPFLKTPEKGES